LHLGPQLSSPSPLDHPEAFPLVHQAAAHLVPFSPPQPAGPPNPRSHLRVGPSRQPHPYLFFPLPVSLPTVTRAGASRAGPMADASHGRPFPVVLARGMKATRPPESNPHHPPLLQTLGRCPFKAAPAAPPCGCAAAHLMRRNPERGEEGKEAQ
jgi:hypothetical protein